MLDEEPQLPEVEVDISISALDSNVERKGNAVFKVQGKNSSSVGNSPKKENKSYSPTRQSESTKKYNDTPKKRRP